MSKRDRYEPGVPCWVDTLQPDPDTAVDFYGRLFGWQFAGPGAIPGGGDYFVARLGDHDVAGVGAMRAEGALPRPAWNTHVCVRDADEAVATTTAAGGRVLAGPFEALPAGRMAALADPAGATFCAWQPGQRQGAQRVNEAGAWSMSLLSTHDVEGAKEFYRAVFGWQPETMRFGDSEMTLWRLPGYVGGEPQQPVPRDVVAALLPSEGDAPSAWNVNFWARATDEVAETATARGGAVIVPPHDTPGFRNAVLADPHGAAFSVSQPLAVR